MLSLNYSCLAPESGRYTEGIKNTIIERIGESTSVPEKAKNALWLTDTEVSVWKDTLGKTNDRKNRTAQDIFEILNKRYGYTETKSSEDIEWLDPLESKYLKVLKSFKWNVVPKPILLELSKSKEDPKIVDVKICHLREKLKRIGYDIETVWWRGYALISTKD